MTIICDVKIVLIIFKPHYIKLIFMNLIHSQLVQSFNIFHLVNVFSKCWLKFYWSKDDRVGVMGG